MADLKRGQSFLLADRILVCRERRMATTTEDFTNAKGQVCVSVDKRYGSELTLLHSAIANLDEFLNPPCNTSSAHAA